MKHCIPFFIILCCLADMGLGQSGTAENNSARKLETKREYSETVEFHHSPFDIEVPGADKKKGRQDDNLLIDQDEIDRMNDYIMRQYNTPAWMPPVPPPTRKETKKDNWILPPQDGDQEPGISLFGTDADEKETSGWGWLAEEMKRRTEQAKTEKEQQNEQDEETEAETNEQTVENLDEEELMERAQKEKQKPLQPVLTALSDFQPANKATSAATAPVSGFERMKQDEALEPERNEKNELAESFDFGSNPLGESPDFSMLSEEDPWAAKQDEWNNESPYASPFSSGPVQEKQIIPAPERSWGMAAEGQINERVQQPTTFSDPSFVVTKMPNYQASWEAQQLGASSIGGESGMGMAPLDTEPETSPAEDRWADRDIFREPLFNPEAHSLFK